MSKSKTLFDVRWDVEKYRNNYDSEHWDLCKAFMETHKTKYPEQKLVHLTEAFYQMGVYGSSYDPKTTRMVNALTVEVLDNVLKSHPGVLSHPFNKSGVVVAPQLSVCAGTEPSKDMKVSNQSTSIWDVQVDQSIIANVLVETQLRELFKGFVIIYDIRRASTMVDNKVTILEESFKRSKFGPCHWAKEDTHNNICPLRISLKWRNVVLAEAVGGDEKCLKTRLAQAILSKMSNFSSGIEAKWSYYRDGRLPDSFDHPNPKKSHIYRVLRRSQFKDMLEITSFIDTFANSDSFAEVAFSMDFSNQEKKQLMEYIDKTWCTKLTYRTLSKIGVKNKSESHVFVYHIRSGEELRRWLELTDGENERYRMVPPGKHRRAGTCDSNVREVLTTDSVEKPTEMQPKVLRKSKWDVGKDQREELVIQKEVPPVKNDQTKETISKDKEKKDSSEKKDKPPEKENKGKDTNKNEKEKLKTSQDGEDDLEKILDGFVLFYDANQNSEIDKDDWFTALCESFKISKFGPLEVIVENVRPLRTSCVFKLNERTLASAEGLTETQAKTAATLQLISKLEPFTYIIQAKEDYFCGGKVPSFLEDPGENQNDFYRLVHRKDLPSYYTIFQTIDDFARGQSHGEIIFGPDFTWELKNEISVYLKAKGLSHRYFTSDGQQPWTHMAVFRTVKPDELKEFLLKNGGENDKYKLIPPPKAEPISYKTSEESKVKSTKEAEKPPVPSAAKKPAVKENKVEKRKQEPEPTPEPKLDEIDSNKIQIKLKKFKVDKVDYPEDTGGDFPGLIIWVGIRKNSVWQKNLFNILLESFKMSKYGELLIEESEESVWGRKEPFKKCVIKASRKVLAVGLGESKTEAKNSASLQVLRHLRKHCYTIQAKESYFKEGKATPYDFNPDPAKSHVYKLMKRNRFKDRAAMVKYVNDFSKNNCFEEVIFGDDFTYDEREYILDHCRKINLSYRLIKCQSITKNMHTHIAIFHQLPLPIIKAELMKTGGENDMYRLVPPGGIITNQNNQADMWPDTLENGKDVPATDTAQLKTDMPVQQSSPSQQSLLTNQTPINNKPIPSLLNRVAVDINEKEVDNFSLSLKVVDSKVGGKKVSVNVLGGNVGSAPVLANDQEVKAQTSQQKNLKENQNQSDGPRPIHNQSKGPKPIQNQPKGPQPLHNQTIGPQPKNQPIAPQPLQKQPIAPQPLQKQPIGPRPLQNQPIGPQPLQNQPIGPQPLKNQPIGPQPLQNQGIGPQPLQNQPIGPQPLKNQPIGPQPLQNQTIGPQPLQNQPIGPQPQFPPVHVQEVPFGPQPLFNVPPPPLYSQPFMDVPLQFGPNPPIFYPQNPVGPAGMNTGMPTMGPQVEITNQPSINNTYPTNQNSLPSITKTVQNSPPKTDLREELAEKKRQANQKRVMSFGNRQAENRLGSPDRVVFDMTTERRIINTDDNDSDGWSRKVFVADPGGPAEEQRRDIIEQGDLREKLRHKEPIREVNEPEERIVRNNSPQRNFRNRRSPQKMSPERRRSRGISRERWRSRNQSPEQRIIRRRDSSHERRVFHDPSRSTGGNHNRIQTSRFRSRSRSFSPRRHERSPSPTVLYRDLWDNIPIRHSQSIFMYKYVKQDSTTETDPYSLLRATRSLSFNVDFDFIKEQTAIDEWYVSVELITDDANNHPLVGEGMARTEREASRRAADHAVDTIQKACRVIEPNFRYFCEGGVPDFITRKNPMKTSVYEIIQNMDPGTPLARYTVEMMFKMFMSSDLEDIFFLATDFSYLERVLVIEVATQMNLWWRLFGPRHPSARPDDVVSTQHVCVFKQKSALQLVRELTARGGSTEKYSLVDPREYRLTRPRPERRQR